MSNWPPLHKNTPFLVTWVIVKLLTLASDITEKEHYGHLSDFGWYEVMKVIVGLIRLQDDNSTKRNNINGGTSIITTHVDLNLTHHTHYLHQWQTLDKTNQPLEQTTAQDTATETTQTTKTTHSSFLAWQQIANYVDVDVMQTQRANNVTTDTNLLLLYLSLSLSLTLSLCVCVCVCVCVDSLGPQLKFVSTCRKYIRVSSSTFVCNLTFVKSPQMCLCLAHPPLPLPSRLSSRCQSLHFVFFFMTVEIVATTVMHWMLN